MQDRIQQALARRMNVTPIAAREIPMKGRAGADWHKPAVVFVPDLHWLSAAAEGRYRYSFGNFNGQDSGRRALFENLCQVLGTMAEQVSVIQLGDIFDVWRETTQHTCSRAQIRAIAASNPWDALLPLVRGANGRMLLGNHDRLGYDSIEAVVRREYGVSLKTHHEILFTRRVLVLHGDLADPIEGLPDWLQNLAVKAAGPGHAETIYPLDGEATNGVTELRRRVGALATRVRNGDPSARNLLQLRNGCALGELGVVVIGHTHHAGIQVADNMCVVDCGAWLEGCSVAGRSMPSAQIAVVTGDEKACSVRLYQLEPRP